MRNTVSLFIVLNLLAGCVTTVSIYNPDTRPDEDLGSFFVQRYGFFNSGYDIDGIKIRDMDLPNSNFFNIGLSQEREFFLRPGRYGVAATCSNSSLSSNPVSYFEVEERGRYTMFCQRVISRNDEGRRIGRMRIMVIPLTEYEEHMHTLSLIDNEDQTKPN